MENQPEPLTPAERTCANCACFGYMGSDGKVSALDPTHPENMPVCRRNTPGGKFVQVEVPKLDGTGKPIMGRNGPATTYKQQLQIGYPPTVPEATCYDGWRPPGTLPGDNFKVARMETVLYQLLKVIGVPPVDTTVCARN